MGVPTIIIESSYIPYDYIHHSSRYSFHSLDTALIKKKTAIQEKDDLAGHTCMSFLSLKNSKQNKKSYLQFFETDEIFGELYDRLLAGHQRNERTQTLFFHLITDRGKFAVKNEDGMGKRKERTDFGSSAACGSNAHSAIVSPRGRTFLSL